MAHEPPGRPGTRRRLSLAGQRGRVVALILLATLPLLLLAAVSTWLNGADAEADVVHDRLALARAAATATDTFVEASFSTVRTLALNRIGSPELASASLPLFQRFLVENPDWEEISLYDPAGWNVVGANRVAPTTPRTVNLADRPDFQDVVNSGRSRVTDGVVSPVTGNATVVLIAPVEFVATGRGTLNAALALDRLRTQLLALRGQLGATLQVVDTRGQVLVDTSPTPPPLLATVMGTDAAREALAARAGTRRETGPAGQELLVAYAPVTGLNWAVVLREPAGEAFAVSRRHRIEGYGLTLIALGVALWLAWGLGGRLAAVAEREQVARASAEATAAELREVGQASEAQRRFLEELIASAPVAIAALAGPDHRHVTVNGHYRALKPHADIGGRTVAEAFPEFVPQRIVAMLDRVWATGQQFTAIDCAVKIDDAAGEPADRFLTLVFARYDDAGGQPLGVLVVALDTTESVMARRQVERDKDQFLSMAAHELKTPLTSLNLSVQLIGRMVRRDAIDPARLERSLGVIQEQVGRATRLIDDLLDVSFLELGNLPVRRARFDLAALARWVVERQQETRAETGGPDFVVEAPPAGLVVEADETRLDQVLTNLLSNAVKYGAEGGAVTVRVWADGGDSCFAVADRGGGVPLPERERIFTPFARARDVVEQGITGTGLGLYIARRIVEAHGGEIRCSETPGGGATFTVRLPYRQATAAEAALSSRGPAPSAP